MDRAGALRARLGELRQGFDGAFAVPLVEQADDGTNLLVIRVGRELHAVRLSDIAALEARCALTPVPSAQPELLGIAGLRGAVVAVFDLAALIGGARGDATWLLLARGSSKVAFAFSAFEGTLNVARDQLGRAPTARGARVRDVVWREGQPLPVIDIAGLVGDLERRSSSAAGEVRG